MTAKDKLPKDHELAKSSKTMSAGVTASKLELGATIDLHGHSLKITSTNAEDTTVQYANLVRRTFDTHILNSYLDLGTFPVGAAFERATPYRNERAIIEAVTGDCCYQVRIVSGSDAPHHETYSYGDFIGWHMSNGSKFSYLLYQDTDKDDVVEEMGTVDEALDGEANNFEEDLQKRIKQLEEDLAASEIEGQKRINELTKMLSDSKTDLLNQDSINNTRLLAKQAEIERLEAKASLLAPVCKEFCIKQDISEADLNKMAAEGWQVQHMQFVVSQLSVVLFRELSTPAPKVAQPVAVAVPHISTVPPVRPPVQRPPMPVGHSVVNLNTPVVSRALTNNGPKPGDTKRIPTLADIEARRERHANELAEIAQRGRDQQQALRQQAAQSPRSFNLITGGQ